MIHTLSKKNHAELIEQSSKPVIVKIFATWCPPCVQVKPIFEKLSEEFGETYTFAQLNVDEERDLAIKYGVTSIPSFLFIRNNTVLAHEIGYQSREDLLEKMKLYIGNPV